MNRLVLELEMPATPAGAEVIAAISGYPVRYVDPAGVSRVADPKNPEDAEPGDWADES